ncbi:MAG: hypothetical protein H3Z52_06190 [archaeon]|nr:hypothetical protein [archaeon]MCP8320512.1 hypothetical protein [archaeon]
MRAKATGVSIPDDLFQTIEERRWRLRLNRSQYIVHLLKKGLEVEVNEKDKEV